MQAIISLYITAYSCTRHESHRLVLLASIATVAASFGRRRGRGHATSVKRRAAKGAWIRGWHAVEAGHTWRGAKAVWWKRSVEEARRGHMHAAAHLRRWWRHGSRGEVGRKHVRHGHGAAGRAAGEPRGGDHHRSAAASALLAGRWTTNAGRETGAMHPAGRHVVQAWGRWSLENLRRVRSRFGI